MRIIDTPEQKDFPGFEHTGQFRMPDHEPYQNCFGHLDHSDKIMPYEPVWILRWNNSIPVGAFGNPPQRHFPGFEHTGEFRGPKRGEYFQTFIEPLQVWKSTSPYDEEYPAWILRKVEPENDLNLFYTRDYIRQIRTSLDIIKEQVDYLEKELFKK